MTLEELQEQILKLSENLNNLKSENESLKTEHEQAIKRQRELEEHNQKLFLRVTTKIDDTKTEENEEEKEIKEFVGENLYDSLNKKEKELLNVIVKGEDE